MNHNIMKKQINPLIVLMLGLLLHNTRAAETGKFSFSSNWRFHIEVKNQTDSINYLKPGFNDSTWESVDLPHTPRIEPLLVNDQFQGVSWYRKTFEIPKNYQDKKMLIELGAAMNKAQVWINGKLVTTHEGGYLPVVFDITPYVRAGTKNLITVRLDNRDNDITGPKPLERLDFNTYGGLYRNAWLIVKNKVHISHPILANKPAGGGIFISYPQVGNDKATVRVKTDVINEDKKSQKFRLTHEFFYKKKKILEIQGGVHKIEAGMSVENIEEVTIDSPLLWSPESPDLYTLETSIIIDGKRVDMESTRFGIREFTFDSQNQLLINGEKTFLRGVNRHQEYPFIGYALSDNAQYRDAKKIKDAGFNYVRLSHYPHSPAFLSACDELGLVVLDAILGWQFYNDTGEFRENRYNAATDLIRRDRNHPSVLAWEVSLNETQMPKFFMKQLNRIVQTEYPENYAYSAGWMNDVYDIFLQARQHRILHGYHADEIKDKPYSVSEYGDWEYFSKNAGLNQDALPNELRVELSSRQLRRYGEKRLLYQVSNVQEAHNDNLSTLAFSDSYWVMFDYNRGYYDNLEASGLMDIFRIPKFAYYFFQSQQDPEQNVSMHIGSYWDKRSPLNIKVFSNSDEVALYKNNRLIGRQGPDQDSISTNLEHAPFTFNLNSFEAGSLKAVGYINGEKVDEQVVHTPGTPTRLKIWLDESGKKPEAGVKDTLFLYIAAIDENGTIIHDYDNVIDLKLKGDAHILNPDQIKAEAGIATALIAIGRTAGKVWVEAKSKKLSPENYSFNVIKHTYDQN